MEVAFLQLQNDAIVIASLGMGDFAQVKSMRKIIQYCQLIPELQYREKPEPRT